MTKDEIEQSLNQLNLEADCFDREITPLIKKLKSSSEPQIKLYLHINDACVENDNFQWYLLEDVIQFNLEREIPVHNCLERECNVEGYVISLIVYAGGDTRFTKTNRIEIIYF
jgi:hypothetical protein